MTKAPIHTDACTVVNVTMQDVSVLQELQDGGFGRRLKQLVTMNESGTPVTLQVVSVEGQHTPVIMTAPPISISTV